MLFNPDNSGVKEIIEELELSIAKKWMPRQVEAAIIKAFTLDCFIYKQVTEALRNKEKKKEKLKKWFPYIDLLFEEFYVNKKKLDMNQLSRLYKGVHFP